MSCNFPVGTQDKDGIALYRPCGTCMGCRLDYSKDWAIRICHESQLQEDNDFITLTFNDENLPLDGSVHKRDLELFIKRLRATLYPKTIRYYACGEYGENLNRPHYHAIIFNHQFTHKTPLFLSGKRLGTRKGGHDHSLYRSSELEHLWKNGFSTVADVTEQSSAYVARYVCKKIGGKLAKEHYGNKNSEFALMSRNPGIGHDWYKKYKTDVFPKDFVTLNGKKYRVPRYYYSLLEKENFVEARMIKKRRREKSQEKPYENTMRQMQKEYHRTQVTKTLERII